MFLRCLAITVLYASSLFAVESPEVPKDAATSSSADTKLVASAATKDAIDPAMLPVIAPKQENACAKAAVAGEKTGPECRVHWTRMTAETLEFMSFQHWLNASTYKGELKGRFFHDWFHSVRQQRISVWTDGDPFIVNYIGHPMSGATYARTFIQNDPKGASLEFSKNKAYWKSRLKAMGWAAVWSTEWEIGPMSEASFGNIGSFNYRNETTGRYTNGTGLTDFVATPVGGTIWVIGEDVIDKYLTKRLDQKFHNPLALMGISVLTPTHSVGNLLRFKTPWHRDSRHVGGWDRLKSW
jgi:hypothetical protein